MRHSVQQNGSSYITTQLTDVNEGVVVGAESTITGVLAELAHSTICGTDCSGLAHFMHIAPLFIMLQLLQYIGWNIHNREMQTTEIPQ